MLTEGTKAEVAHHLCGKCGNIIFIKVRLQIYTHAYLRSLLTITPFHTHSLYVEYIHGVVLGNISFFHGRFVCVGENRALRLLLPLL